MIHLADLLEQNADDTYTAKSDSVPSQLRHCMVAVSKKKGGSTKTGARASWNICRWHLIRSGYLKKPYRINDKAARVRMTQKGTRASMRHSMERGSQGKGRQFHDLFRRIAKDV